MSRLLTVYFRAGRTILQGPNAAWISLRDGELFVADLPGPVAFYSARGWMYQGAEFTEIECHGFIFVELLKEGAATALRVGPRPSLRVRNAHVFAGRQLIATYREEKRCWMTPGRRDTWSMVRVCSAE